ncbi:MAG: signal recognition particle-docking protein FtsY [Actinomycetota bacterium]
MNAQTTILVLIAVTLVFGFGVVIAARRRAGRPTESKSTNEGGTNASTVRPSSIRDRLSRTAGVFSTSLGGIRQRSGITRETWDDLEAMLLRADVGVSVTNSVLQDLRGRVDAKEIRDGEELVAAVRSALMGTLLRGPRAMSSGTVESGRIDVWLLVGVNGVGKTTTVGKLAAQQAAAGRKVLLAAGDTFRAAAAEQLEMWGERTGVDVVRGSEGGDPSSVVFDAIQRGASRDYDLIIADTAGRLHTKSNLMDELRKVRRIADREPGSVTEVLLVIDATTGQNGLAQARQFSEAAGVTGVVLTKLDGSAKGGIVFAIESELGLPVKFVGVGETVGDLVPFDTDEFVSALFDV